MRKTMTKNIAKKVTYYCVLFREEYKWHVQCYEYGVSFLANTLRDAEILVREELWQLFIEMRIRPTPHSWNFIEEQMQKYNAFAIVPFTITYVEEQTNDR
jgi:hypothetical protein